MTRGLAPHALAALAVVASGCQDPYAANDAAPSPSATRTATTTERPDAPTVAIELPRRSWPRSARAAATAFATRWVNWDWRTVDEQQRQLAHLADGALARQLALSAASSRLDASLQRDRPGSRGTVVATSLRVDANRARGLVVTREQTTTAGRPNLGGQRYRVYTVRVTARGEQWGVSAWQPQP